MRTMRLALGWSLREMAVYLGLGDPSQVCHLESGRTPLRGPVQRLLLRLAQDEGFEFSEKNAERA